MKVAPKEKIEEDFYAFEPNLAVDKSFTLDTALNCLSVAGHASQGHAKFNGKKFPDTSALDVLNAVVKNKNSTEKTRRNVSANIDAAKKLLEHLLTTVLDMPDPKKSKLYNEKLDGFEVMNLDTGKTLFGMNAFSPKNFVIYNPLTFLQGAYIASQMDSSKARKETCKHFKKIILDKNTDLKIGTGTCHVANLSRLRNRGIKLSQFANGEVEFSDIEKLIRNDVILRKKKLFSHKADQYNPHHFNLYVREDQGLGCCDDATLLTIGRIFLNQGPQYALDAFNGAAVIDTIDTIDKMSAMLVTGGADEYIGSYINNKFKNRTGSDLVDKETIYTAIYGGAKKNLASATFSSSIRRFHELQNINKAGHLMTPFESHKKYLITGEKTPNLKLGFEKYDSMQFYNTIDTVHQKMESEGMLDRAA